MPGTSDDLGDLPLFQRVAWTPSSDTDTSLEAAHKIVPRAMTDEHRVLEALREKPDTDEGLSERLGLSGNSIRPRRGSLVAKGLVEQDPDNYGKTKSGRRAKIWRVVGG